MNFASIAYFQPQSPMAVYSAAKAAVAGFTQSLAVELRDRKIRVNAVAPGMVRTSDNVASAGDGRGLRRARGHHRRRDVTRRALLSITGHILPIAPARPRHGLMELATASRSSRAPVAGWAGPSRSARRTRNGRRHSSSRLGQRCARSCAARSSRRRPRRLLRRRSLGRRGRRRAAEPRGRRVRPARRAGQFRGGDAPALLRGDDAGPVGCDHGAQPSRRILLHPGGRGRAPGGGGQDRQYRRPERPPALARLRRRIPCPRPASSC